MATLQQYNISIVASSKYNYIFQREHAPNNYYNTYDSSSYLIP